MLEDVQARPDSRGIGLDEVGVADLRYPVLVSDGQGNKRETVATVSMSVSLGHHVKGAHLSRFVETLHAWRDQLSIGSVMLMADDLRQRMESDQANVTVSFTYFLERAAPVTGSVSYMDYACAITATAGRTSTVRLRAMVPVTSVCPCSKAISDRGAHNQRGTITIDVATPSDTDLWFDDLIQFAETAGSSPVYALLKRSDERHVTMAGYDNPVFVEDMARTVAGHLADDPRVGDFTVHVVNDESIHNHVAFAHVGSATVRQGRA
jgi:GTP cyclohydrolase IB